MKIRDIPLHDAHLHIKKGEPISSYLEIAETLGTETLGITEHLWDIANIPTGEAYYQDKTLERVLDMRKAAPCPERPKILWGCETEYAGVSSQVGICPPRSELLDYVVIPHSHFFLPGFTFPAGMSKPGEIAGYMVKTFREVAVLPFGAVIAHPFDPTASQFQREDFLASVFGFLPETLLRECFSLAARNRKIIEINLGSFVHGLENPLYQKTFLPMFAAAKQEGCRFCLASDAQKPADLFRLAPDNARYIIEALNLHREDFVIPGVDVIPA